MKRIIISALFLILLSSFVQAQAPTQPKILGRSTSTSTGRFNFGGKRGTQAANEMCKATYPSVSNAHLCDISEVNRAVASGNYGTGTIDNVTTWTVAQSFEFFTNKI